MSVVADSAVSERLEARRAVIGDGLEIRRAVPNRHRRMVGAWCFLDHAGPMEYAPGQGLSIGPHPHIGLQTFTWMIEGEVLHRDSLGYEQWIHPGQVNLMTAGRGISHSGNRRQIAAGDFTRPSSGSPCRRPSGIASRISAITRNCLSSNPAVSVSLCWPAQAPAKCRPYGCTRR